MKTIANIIIINSQNVESEHLLAVITTSIFKEESSSYLTWMSSTEVANTGLPKLPMDDLKSLRHWLTELHVLATSYCMEYKCMQFSVAIFDVHACSYYIWLQLQRDAQ